MTGRTAGRKGRTGGCRYALCATVWVSALSNCTCGDRGPTHPYSIRPQRSIRGAALGSIVLCNVEEEVLGLASFSTGRQHVAGVAVHAGAGRIF